ncbi:hypothetical protein E4U31_007205 [Claviceps sp. LM219 group G6]|nr:hypothetical protein E4U31_007205 [Claviceps sp. LM219 group G6]
MPSIQDILARPNPPLNSDAVPPGPNSNNARWDFLDEWTPWTEFTYENLMPLYAELLNAPWEAPSSANMMCSHERSVRDERSVEHYLAKFIWPSVNGALEEACRILKWEPETAFLGNGGWTQGALGLWPDWALVPMPANAEKGKLDNYLPGDTKVSAKWTPRMSDSEDEGELLQWSLPLSQVGMYAKETNRRYGFIVTDKSLVVLRFAKERIGEGIAAGRPRRIVAPQSHRRTPSNETVVSSHAGTVATSQRSFGAQSYDNDDPINILHLDLLPPEYAEIPYSASGKGKLTYKFAMFCLCLMAYGGRGRLDYEYPPFNSWRREGGWFMNNTSNLKSQEMPRDAVLDETEE